MNLPASEIQFWQEYYAIFPFPQDRKDIQTALLAAVIYNTSGVKKAKNLEDFLPDYLKNNKAATKMSREALDQEAQKWLRFAKARNEAIKAGVKIRRKEG